MLLQATSSTSQWGIGELVLSSRSEYDNPFREVEVTGVFRSPSGHDVRARGFYDGGRIWRIRLMPDEVGTWTFTTSSADGELDGLTGSLEVGPARPGRHGPVHVSRGRHFAHADGTPYFLLGTALYQGLVRGADELNRTVAKLSGSPFTKARFMLLGGDMSPGAADPFERHADGLDYARPDPSFFRAVEQGLAQVQELGVEADLVLLVPYFDLRPHAAFGDVTPSSMGQDNDECLARHAASRLSAFANVWWTLANEFDLFPVHKDWDAIARAVADGDPYGHLISNHHSILAFFDNSAGWITHMNLQDVLLQRSAGGPRNLGELALDAHTIGKPVVVDEYGYEGNNGYTWGSFSAPEIVEMLGGHPGRRPRVTRRKLRRPGPGGPVSGGRRSPAAVPAGGHGIGAVPGDGAGQRHPRLRRRGLRPGRAGEARRRLSRLFPGPRELPDWNLGNFGPATPSRPLPRPGGVEFAMTDTAVTVTLDKARYEVTVIDPGRMSVTPLGVTEEDVFTITPRLTPGILRFRRTDATSAGARPVAELLGEAGLGTR